MAIRIAQTPKRGALWLGAAALLLLGGGFIALRSMQEARRAEQEAAALPPPPRVNVAALGRVEPQGRVVDIASAEPGILARLLVSEGDRVEANQVLARLDMYDIRKAERDYAASQLAEAENQLAAERQLGTARIDQAQAQTAQVDEPQAKAIEAQDAQIRSLQAQLALAETDLDRFEGLFDQGAVTRQQLDSQRTEVAQLQSDIANAEATRTQLVTARAADLEVAAAQVDRAEADVQLAMVETGVTSARQNLVLAEARLQRTLITAPQAGQVLDIYVEPGEAVDSQRLMSLGNTAEMYVVAEVYETDVGLVRPGQPVKIVSRNGAFDGTLTGTVEQVGLQIFKNDVLDDDPAANADARIVEVRIAVDQDEEIAGLTNLQVDVLIDIDKPVSALPR